MNRRDILRNYLVAKTTFKLTYKNWGLLALAEAIG